MDNVLPTGKRIDSDRKTCEVVRGVRVNCPPAADPERFDQRGTRIYCLARAVRQHCDATCWNADRSNAPPCPLTMFSAVLTAIVFEPLD